MADAFIGEIRLVPYVRSDPPVGWLNCDGKVVYISAYQALFSLIGVTYGGDGKSTFGLPDFNGRVLVGQGVGQAAPNTNSPGTLTSRSVGEKGGSESVALTTEMIPPHSHTFYATTQENTTQTPGTGVLFGSSQDPAYKRYVSPVPKPLPRIGVFNDDVLSYAGAGQPHPNIMNSLGLKYIICFEGEYPMKSIY